MNKISNIQITDSNPDYELLDSGEGEKLERFGQFTLARPDPQALWHKRLSADEWKKADGAFTNSWNMRKTTSDKWQIAFGGLKFWIRPSSFKHVGLFPEQAVNWEWLRSCIEAGRKEEGGRNGSGESAVGQRRTGAVPDDVDGIEILNLFGYTGGASLACAQAGAKVVHVDGSKVAISWARENAELSGLEKKPIRWILDDAHTFVKREVKRGRKYAGIIMDPPAFGHGPDNELWKIEESLLPLIDDCIKILADKPLFFIINVYASGYSPVAYENILKPLVEKFGGRIEMGELAIEEGGRNGSGLSVVGQRQTGSVPDDAHVNYQQHRLLPCGIFARWSA